MRSLSERSTGLSRHERRDAAGRGRKPALAIYSYDEVARLVGVARRTLERLIAVGDGPAIIELSPRRRGILESDLINWLHKHRRAAPDQYESHAATMPAASSTGAAAATKRNNPAPTR
jgi:hypothetical protein